MLSAARANLFVGPPYDIGIYFNEFRSSASSASTATRLSSRSCRRCGSAISSSGIAKLPAITQDD